MSSINKVQKIEKENNELFDTERDKDNREGIKVCEVLKIHYLL